MTPPTAVSAHPNSFDPVLQLPGLLTRVRAATASLAGVLQSVTSGQPVLHFCKALSCVGGGNPFHEDTSEYLLHEFRLLAQRHAPPGLQLLSCLADGNCQFRAVAAAFNFAQDQQRLTHESLRMQCVEHLRLFTDSAPDALEELSRLGTWGDGLSLSAGAVVAQAEICLFTPWDHSHRTVASHDNPLRRLFLTFNGSHYDCYIPKRRHASRGLPYLHYGDTSHSAPAASAATSLQDEVAPEVSQVQAPACADPVLDPPTDLADAVQLQGQEALDAWESVPDDEGFEEWSRSSIAHGYVVITTCNATSFVAHEEYLASLPTSLLVAQEVSCYGGALSILQLRLSKKSWSVQVGPPPPPKSFSNRESDSAAIGGLLIAARQGSVTTHAQPLPVALMSHRTQVARRILKSTVVYVINVYGFPGGGQQDVLNNHHLLYHVMEFASGLGAVPVLVLGDFSLDLLQSATVRHATQHNWLVANLYGRDKSLPAVKCEISFPRTVDWLLASPVAAPALQGILTWRGQLPTHAAFSAAFRFETLQEPVWSLPAIRRPVLPSPDTCFTTGVWPSEVKSLAEWHRCAEAELRERVLAENLPWTPAMEGRGFRSLVQRQVSGPALRVSPSSCSNADGCLPREVRMLALQSRRLEKLKVLLRASAPSLCEIRSQLRAVWRFDARFGIVRETFPESETFPSDLVVSDFLLREWLKEYRSLFQAKRDEIQRRRISSWKQSLTIADDTLSARAFSRMSAPACPWSGVVHLPARPVDSFSAFFEQLSSFWQKIWCRHGTSQWHDARNIISKFSWPQLCLPVLSGEDLRAALKRSAPTSASGIDGWTHQELSLLSPAAFQHLAEVWNHLEQSAVWRDDLFTWSVAILKPGNSGSSPSDFRLINILSRIFRIALSARARQLLRLLEPHLSAWLVGSVPGRQASNVWLDLAFQIGCAHLQQHTVSGLTLDLYKAFNRLPRVLGHALFSALGLQGWSSAYHALLDALVRTFKSCSAFSPKVFRCTTGYPEGDPVGPVVMLLFSWCWGKHVAAAAAPAKPLAYLDNWEVVHQVASSLQPAWTQVEVPLRAAASSTHEFAQAFDLEVSVKSHKTWFWSTDACVRAGLRQAAVTIQGAVVPIAQSERDLGAQLVYTRQRGSGVIAARFLSASASCRRLQHLPLPYALKVVAVKVKVFPQALYGAEISRPPWRECNHLRSAVSASLWSQERLFRSVPAVLNLVRGVDPSRALAFAPLLALRSLVASHGLSAVWPSLLLSLESPVQQAGFFPRVRDSFTVLAWSASPNGIIVRRHNFVFDFAQVPFQRLWAILCEDWSAHVASSLAMREGAEELQLCRLDLELTAQLLPKVPVQLRSSLEAILGASHRWCVKQLAERHQGDRDGDACPLCGLPAEGPGHAWLSCSHPAMCQVREASPRALQLLSRQSPPFRHYGWLQVYPTADAASARVDVQADVDLQRLQNRVAEFCACPPNSRLLAYTDGSAAPPSVPALRHASWAVILCKGPGSREVVTSQLIGPLQTVNRAELRAVIEAILLGADTVCTDSAYVIRLAREATCQVSASRLANGDLVELFWRLLRRCTCTLRKVASHGKDPAQSLGDTAGNDAADAAAKGACPAVKWLDVYRRALKHDQVITMWSYMARCRTAYLAALPAKPRASSLMDTSAAKTFEEEILSGGKVFTLSATPDISIFTTTGVHSMLRVAGGHFAVALCKFFSQVSWYPGILIMTVKFFSTLLRLNFFWVLR